MLSRFVHYDALLYAFGVSFFPVYAISGRERHGALDHWSKYKGSLFAASLIALASGISWLVFAAASMAGSLSEALSLDTMAAVLGETAFGFVWSVHLGLVATLAVLTGRDRWALRPHSISLTFLSAACLASLAGVGHTQAQEGPAFALRAIADGTHLLAAGAWLGGLVPLLVMLIPRANRSEIDIGRVLMRFSGMGYAAVGLLVGTGVINGLYLVPSILELPSSLYGQLLIVKLGLFSLMLILAAMNRFWLVPRLLAKSAAPQSQAYLSRLRYHIASEQLLGILVIALVSVLGTLPPSEGQ
jgi:putative copper resistance protein D